MANELECCTRDAVHEATAFGFGGIAGVFLNPNYIELENVASGDNEIRNWADASAPRRPIGGGIKIIGLHRRDLRGEVCAAMRDEAGGTVFDAGRPVHHLVGCVAHCLILVVR